MALQTLTIPSRQSTKSTTSVDTDGLDITLPVGAAVVLLRSTTACLWRWSSSDDLVPLGSIPFASSGGFFSLDFNYLNVVTATTAGDEYRAAIKEFLIVLRLTPEDKDIYYFLASAYHGLEMYPEAYDYYKRVDRGRYVQVAQSGAKRTQKLAADQQRRTNP